jgi:cytochrome c oxidase accessory protein FixG
MAVSYDFKRGEPRAHKRNQNESTGDCVDCSLCVQVCPTGIDIRNGLQMECVNCTACIDACDTVMDKVGKETGLIRYASKHGIITGQKFKFNPRIIAYSTLLLVLMTILFSLFGTRKEVDTKILRARGSLFSVVNVDSISNIYSYEVVNKKFEAMDFSFRVAEPFTARVEMIGDFTHVDEHGMVEGIFKLIIPKSQLNGIKNEIHIEIMSENRVVDRIETNFLGPAK